MRRFVYPIDLNAIKRKDFDVIIVGSGLAGLYAALNVSSNLRVAILSKSIDETSSYLSQGGVAAVINPDDNYEKHIKDTLIAGAGLCDESAVRFLIEEGPKEIKRLLEWDVPFDKTDEGKLQTTLEGGHSMRRILHCGGDKTGKQIVEHLMQLVEEAPNIKEIHHSYLIDVLSQDNQVAGILMYHHDKPIYLAAPFVILCTGGIGALYPSSTNPPIATGDGIAAAIRAGVNVNNMEFVQFHPTSFYDPHDNGRSFLISEALRGEGAILKNEAGEAFMQGKHPLADLAPRDIVAREISKQINKSSLPYVYLDITHHTKEFLEKRFPTIYNHCLSHDIDISKQWIKVRPVQHYFMGGIVTDLKARTTIKGLYACGETACTGVHGANRLASNSLLECLVFSHKAAEDINSNFYSAKSPCPPNKLDAPPMTATCPDFSELIDKIKNIMYNCAGIVRDGNSLLESINTMSNILNNLSSFCVPDRQYLKVLNMATVGLQILNAAYMRKESVGAHYRSDGE